MAGVWCACLWERAKVIIDGMACWCHNNGDILPQEFPIADCDASGSVDFNDILIELPDLNNQASLVPLGRVVACLILDADMVANF